MKFALSGAELVDTASANMSLQLLAASYWLLAGQRNISPSCQVRPAFKDIRECFAKG